MFSYLEYYSTWFIYVLPAVLFAAYAQAKVSGAYKKYSKMPSNSSMTGAQVARYILDRNGLNHVRIEQVRGVLSDHYDPRTKVLRLSPEVYSGQSIASVSVAAHEVGHAIQHDNGYFPLILRNTIAPIAMFASNLVWIFIIIGFIISPFFIDLGIALFMAAVLFQVVTLPVEFNASKRALEQLENGVISRDQSSHVKSMLNAAALTYVAATLVAIAELLRLLAITNRRRR
ncbi:MAG: zinc metallopeptidase [Tissierellales bacterium]|nr:zinc metallopeptidase [Tissierellales bacterium]